MEKIGSISGITVYKSGSELIQVIPDGMTGEKLQKIRDSKRWKQFIKKNF